MGKKLPPTGRWVERMANANPAQARWERKEAERLREIKVKKDLKSRARRKGRKNRGKHKKQVGDKPENAG